MTRASAALHADAVVVDCHNDLTMLVTYRALHGQPTYFRDHWLPQLRAGGVDVQVLPIYIDPVYLPGDALQQSLRMLAHIHRMAAEDGVLLCGNGEQIDAATAGGRIALIPALEGCAPIGTAIELIEVFFQLGVRMASFTHFGRTMLADGSAEDAAGGRLTQLGVAALGEMERLGMLVDTSHVSLAGVDHVLELASRPVIASHSSAKALHEHHRNLPDAQLRGIAATGGVVGINCFPGLLAPGPQVTLDHVVDHIEHVASVAGIEHVGLGPDFVAEVAAELYSGPAAQMEGLDITRTVAGLAGPADLPNVTEALVRRGFSEGDIRAVLGGNFLRVFRAVMGVAGDRPTLGLSAQALARDLGNADEASRLVVRKA